MRVHISLFYPHTLQCTVIGVNAVQHEGGMASLTIKQLHSRRSVSKFRKQLLVVTFTYFPSSISKLPIFMQNIYKIQATNILQICLYINVNLIDHRLKY